MSYIENLLGSPVIPEVQESLGLAAGNYKIKGFNLYASGDLVILDEGLALVDGLRIVSSANLKLSKSSVLSKYVFLRIYTYTEIIDGLYVRNANLSLIAQASSTPVNNTNLYDNATGTKDVLLAYVNSSGVVDLNTNGALGVYDIPTRLTSVETKNTSQDSSISSLGTRMTAVETKNTSQDTSITSLGTRATNLETRATNIETKNTEQDIRLTALEADTGWVNIPYNTGWSGETGGQLQYRKIGNQVFLRGGVGQTVIADGNYRSVATNGLPPTFRPPTEVRFTGMGGSGRPIGWRITVTGNIDVINQASNTNASWASVFCSWLLD